MWSSGDEIYQCNNVVQFLQVMYDVLEAHRYAFVERKILHRDVNMHNILIKPAGHIAVKIQEPRPKFSNEILGYGTCAPSMALLFDLDNGCEYDPKTSQSALLNNTDQGLKTDRTHLKNQIGTPICVSSVTPGSNLTTCPFLSDSPLPPNHTPRRDLRVNDDNASFVHQPRHDAESVYWIIVTFLLRAFPEEDLRDTADKNTNMTLKDTWDSLTHHITVSWRSKPVADEGRRALLRYSRQEWSAVLHRGLRPLAAFLASLSSQVALEYGLPDTRLPPAHLHEAMQLLILQQIVDMKRKPIRLCRTDLRSSLSGLAV